MEPIKPETEEEYFKRLEEAAKTLTQSQIDACAWVMGGSGCGWNKDSILNALPLRTFSPENVD